MYIKLDVSLMVENESDHKDFFYLNFVDLCPLQIQKDDLSWKQKLLELLLNYEISLEDIKNLSIDKRQFRSVHAENNRWIYVIQQEEPRPEIFVSMFAKIENASKINLCLRVSFQRVLEALPDDYDMCASYSISFSLPVCGHDYQKKYRILPAIIAAIPELVQKRLVNAKNMDIINSFLQNAEGVDWQQTPLALLRNQIPAIDNIAEYVNMNDVDFEKFAAKAIIQQMSEQFRRQWAEEKELFLANLYFINPSQQKIMEIDIESVTALQGQFGSKILCEK